ncbi:DUF1761 domain-containing protein [Denitrobaculum tricleocarpae]|uniref:DUF1761 domain-containing protein n=1 Tax=Denitrobaculum tricleocarpae TaxID=2591009 RepID=A0A545TKU0_9PROT|nr:DUF1761 domain-containing protein [Denitrobaculum tricleocarpae]TQV77842.1 DUF1761 domain-containing protein [Denitrobaculum tricleocarpae]
MLFSGINYIAVVVAGIASFAFGAVYYMTLARPWMAAIGKTEEQVKSESSPVVYIVAIVSQLVMAFMLAAVLGHMIPLGSGESSAPSVTLANGLVTGFCIWLGFVLTTMLINHGFQGQKRALSVIDGGHWLGVLLLQGAVIGAFGL